MFKKIIPLLIISACSSVSPQKETLHFSKGEVILSSMLFLNIHDGIMPPLDCIPDRKEAELLLRVIRPRMDEVDIYLDKNLSALESRERLFSQCLDSCSCGYIDQFIKENKISLFEEEKKQWESTYQTYKISRESQCLSYIQSSFCESPLQLELENEKEDFISP